jgi:hypothetical protein
MSVSPPERFSLLRGISRSGRLEAVGGRGPAIRTMLVEPGFFRTEVLTPESTKYAEASVADYAEPTEQTVTAWKSMNGQQGGDPAKLADALVHLATQDEPPLRFPAGADAGRHLREESQGAPPRPPPHRDLSSNLAHDDEAVPGSRARDRASFDSFRDLSISAEIG